jgi:hypothetical protein
MSQLITHEQTVSTVPSVVAPIPAPRPWNWVERSLFRFFFFYLLLYSIDAPLQIAVKAASAVRQKLMENEQYKQNKMRQYAQGQPAAAAQSSAAEDSSERLWQEKYLDPILDGAFKLMQWNADLWNEVVPWVGKQVFDVEVPKRVMRGGSGDGIFSYMQVFTWTAIALALAVVWSLADWWSTSYRRLNYFLRVVVRFTLAYWMIVYGAMKVIKAQFPAPGLNRLMEPYGESSPMGLVWTFMGHSEGYNLFAGMAEMVGGVLLTTRRTTLLGALVSFGAMLHVTSLNFFYDVPVKLFSLHLVFMALFLMAPDVPRLLNLLVFNRPAAPAYHPAIFRRCRWAHYGVIALRTAFVGWLVWQQITDNLQSRKLYGDEKPKPPLYGLYHVEEFTVEGKPVPLPTADKDRWLKLTIDSGFSRDPRAPAPVTATIYLVPQSVYFRDRSNPRPVPDPSVLNYTAKIDTEKRSIVLTDFRGGRKGEFTYTQLEPEPLTAAPDDPRKPIPTRYLSGKLVWEGKMGDKAMKVVLQRVDDMFLLRKEEYKFRWIQETPFNR